MSTAAVIAEYNPFHNGHAYQLKQTKTITGAESVIVVMSGDYVQRGEPAVYDKYLRTKAALRGGADLVIQLPVFFSRSSAAYFARGAVDILNATGITDFLCFGAEDADMNPLYELAKLISEHDAYIKAETKKHLRTGLNYPKARSIALSTLTEHTSLINKPNNTLGVEYIRAIIETNSLIRPVAVQRIGAGYHDMRITGEIASASAVRAAILKGRYNAARQAIPDYAYELYVNEKPHAIDNMSELLQYIIKTGTGEPLVNIDGIAEGLDSSIITAAARKFLMSDIITETKSKRYTFTKIQRSLLSVALQITKEEFLTALNLSAPYIRVLGFRKGTPALNKLCKNAKVPVIINLKHADRALSNRARSILHKDIRCSDIYNLTNGKCLPKNNDYKTPVVIEQKAVLY